MRIKAMKIYRTISLFYTQSTKLKGLRLSSTQNGWI